MPDPIDVPTSVYRFYDTSSILIYVGVTSRGPRRQREHVATKEWWPHVARQEVEHYPSRALALAREEALIKQHQPPFNQQHNAGHQTLRARYKRIANELKHASVGDPYVRFGRMERRLRVVGGRLDSGLVSFVSEPVGYDLQRLLLGGAAKVVRGSSALGHFKDLGAAGWHVTVLADVRRNVEGLAGSLQFKEDTKRRMFVPRRLMLDEL